MTYEHGKYYDCRIIGVRHIKTSKSQTDALEFALRFADGTQDSVFKYLTPKSLSYTQETLVDLGCSMDDITGNDWLRKINARLADKQASALAKDDSEYGVKLNGLFPRMERKPATEVVNAPSPFGGERKRDEFDGGIPAITDDDVPF